MKKSIFVSKNCSELFGNVQSTDSSSTDYIRIDSEPDVNEVEEGCTTDLQHKSNNNADDSVQPYEGEPLADKDWMFINNKERIVEGKC